MQSRLPALVFVVLFFPWHALSQAGTLDSSFGVNGVVTVGVPIKHNELFLEANNIAQQKDGKFIVLAAAAYSNTDPFTEAYVYRFKKNGNTDSSFGTDGKILIYSGNYTLTFWDLVIDSSDNILFSKSVYEDTNNAFEVVRLNKDGKTDSSFGKNGSVSFNAKDNIFSSCNHLALQPDGKILVSGTGSYNNDEVESSSSILFRLKYNGSRDSSFNKTGYIITANANIWPGAGAMVVQSSGKIISGGNFLYRVYKDGTRDLTFGDSGSIIPTHNVILCCNDTGYESFSNLCYSPDDGFMCVGGASELDALAEYVTTNITIYRFTKNGKPDSSLKRDGAFELYNGYYQFVGGPYVRNLVVQPDKKFIIDNNDGGPYTDLSPKLIKYLKTGKKDSSFGSRGAIPFNMSINKILLQNDLKIVTLESSNDYVYDTGYFFIYRYNNDVNVILPVNFTSFTATKNNQSVLLNWNTCNEINNKGFYIQRSNTVNGWEDIGYVSATSIDKACNDYSFTDTKPFSGNNFYRLRQVDNDGKITLSKIVNANFESSSSIKISPNPAKNILTITGLGTNNNSVLYLVNSNGETVNRTQTSNNSFNWNIQNLSSGNYFLVVSQNNKIVASLKFIKQ